jgi:serine/threonine-protein kinase RsbT
VKGHRPRAPVRMAIRREADVVVARALSRELALELGFGEGRAGAIETAVSEVAWNMVVHARAGELDLEVVADRGRLGIAVIARDEEPGIPDVETAMQDGYTTARGLGLGLSGARRLMDEFTVASSAGGGTRVTMKKWTHDAE